MNEILSVKSVTYLVRIIESISSLLYGIFIGWFGNPQDNQWNILSFDFVFILSFSPLLLIFFRFAMNSKRDSLMMDQIFDVMWRH